MRVSRTRGGLALIPPWDRLRTGAGPPPRKLSPSLGSNVTHPHRAQSPSASLAASSNQGQIFTDSASLAPERHGARRLPRAAGACSKSAGSPLWSLAPVPLSSPQLPPAPSPTPAAPASAGPRSSRSPPGASCHRRGSCRRGQGQSQACSYRGEKKLSCLCHIPLPASQQRPVGRLVAPRFPRRAGRSSARGSQRERKWRGRPRATATATGSPRRQQGDPRGGALQPGGTCLRLAPKEKSETKHRKGKGRKPGKL